MCVCPGVVSVAGRVYAVGGFNSSLRERTVDMYDGGRDQWSSVASMQERRSTLGAAVLSDLLYAVGGFNGSIGTHTGELFIHFMFHICFFFSLLIHVSTSVSGLSTVEAYNYKTNEWMYVASMNTRRSSVGVGVVDGKTETRRTSVLFF